MERDSDFLSKIQDTAQVQPRDVNAPLASQFLRGWDADAMPLPRLSSTVQ
jgi:hypothetical protein